MIAYVGAPDLMQMAYAAVFALLAAYGLSWTMDRLFLRRLVRDRVACIAYGCSAVFLLLMFGSTFVLTKMNPYLSGPIIIPPIGYAISFLLGTAAAGALRLVVYSNYEGNLDEEIVFDPDYDDQSLYDQEVLAWDERHGHRNYLLRHWVGHLSLPVSYWVNGAVLPALVFVLVEVAAYHARSKWASLQSLAVIALVYLLVSSIIWVWSSVGIWRSAYWHRRRGGSPGWGFAARALVLLGACGALFRSGDYALQAAEWGGLAIGRDSLGSVAAMKVSADGRDLSVRGTLSEGAGERFETLLNASPKVTQVVLTSPGGRMLEAERMVRAISARGLDTRVEQTCMSACTSVLLAGRERSASEQARIGFHQPTFPGLSSAEMRRAVAEAQSQYVAAGVDPAFVWQAMATPPDDIWIPSQDELLAAHVLTLSEVVGARPGSKVGEGGTDTLPSAFRALNAKMEAVAREANATAPRRLGGVTTFNRASVSGVTLTNYYTLHVSGLDRAAAKSAMAAALRRDACRNAAAVDAISQGGRFVHVYRNEAGKPLFEVVIADCPAG